MDQRLDVTPDASSSARDRLISTWRRASKRHASYTSYKKRRRRKKKKKIVGIRTPTGRETRLGRLPVFVGETMDDQQYITQCSLALWC